MRCARKDIDAQRVARAVTPRRRDVAAIRALPRCYEHGVCFTISMLFELITRPRLMPVAMLIRARRDGAFDAAAAPLSFSPVSPTIISRYMLFCHFLLRGMRHTPLRLTPVFIIDDRG